jgi:hypothetical protein
MARRLRATPALLLLSACNTTPRPMPPTAPDRTGPQLPTALFGLDHALQGPTRLICREAPGSDGMPVIPSRRVAPSATSGRTGTVDAEVLQVALGSGEPRAPACAALAPARYASERHTVLPVGEFASEKDPPLQVTVVGSLPLEGGADARGLSVAVTPLEAGAELVLAFRYTPADLETDCPSPRGPGRQRQLRAPLPRRGGAPCPGPRRSRGRARSPGGPQRQDERGRLAVR